MKTKATFRVLQLVRLVRLVVSTLALLLVGCSAPADSGLRSSSANIRNPGLISLPQTFSSVWYRPGKRGISLTAFSSSGTLTVQEDLIAFDSGSDSLGIRVADIRSVSWGRLSGDSVNDWAIIRYGEPETITGFKDGRSLGWGRETDMIFSTIKYVAEVKGGLAPTAEPFASGWVDIVMGGMMGSNGSLWLSLVLENKSDRQIWAQVVFNGPDGARLCDQTEELSVETNIMFQCAQDSFPPGSYLIQIFVFLDEDRTHLLEKSASRMTFDEEDLQRFQEGMGSTHK